MVQITTVNYPQTIFLTQHQAYPSNQPTIAAHTYVWVVNRGCLLIGDIALVLNQGCLGLFCWGVVVGGLHMCYHVQ